MFGRRNERLARVEQKVEDMDGKLDSIQVDLKDFIGSQSAKPAPVTWKPLIGILTILTGAYTMVIKFMFSWMISK